MKVQCTDVKHLNCNILWNSLVSAMELNLGSISLIIFHHQSNSVANFNEKILMHMTWQAFLLSRHDAFFCHIFTIGEIRVKKHFSWLGICDGKIISETGPWFMLSQSWVKLWWKDCIIHDTMETLTTPWKTWLINWTHHRYSCHPSSTDAGIFRKDKDSIMAADALALCHQVISIAIVSLYI